MRSAPWIPLDRQVGYKTEDTCQVGYCRRRWKIRIELAGQSVMICDHDECRKLVEDCCKIFGEEEALQLITTSSTEKLRALVRSKKGEAPPKCRKSQPVSAICLLCGATIAKRTQTELDCLQFAPGKHVCGKCKRVHAGRTKIPGGWKRSVAETYAELEATRGWTEEEV